MNSDQIWFIRRRLHINQWTLGVRHSSLWTGAPVIGVNSVYGKHCHSDECYDFAYFFLRISNIFFVCFAHGRFGAVRVDLSFPRSHCRCGQSCLTCVTPIRYLYCIKCLMSTRKYSFLYSFVPFKRMMTFQTK